MADNLDDLLKFLAGTRGGSTSTGNTTSVFWNTSTSKWVLPDGTEATTRPSSSTLLIGAPQTQASPSWAGSYDVRMDA